jgi:hypothetical protein
LPTTSIYHTRVRVRLCRAVQNSSADYSLASLRYACRSAVLTCSLPLRLPTPPTPSQLVRSFVCSRTRTQSKHIRLTACSAFGAASLLLTSLHARLVLSVSALVDAPQQPLGARPFSSCFITLPPRIRASSRLSRAHTHCRLISHSPLNLTLTFIRLPLATLRPQQFLFFPLVNSNVSPKLPLRCSALLHT